MLNSLGITDLEQIFLGAFLIVHGAIYVMFLFHFLDKDKNQYLGWTGNSWVLSKIFSDSLTSYIGKAMWLLTIILFILSGLSILDLLGVNEFLSSLIFLSSIVGILAYILFFDGLVPTPYHWILGMVINIALIAYLIFFSENATLLIGILIVIVIWGLLAHSKVIEAIVEVPSN